MRRRRRRGTAAFSLIELLLVIAIIGVLLAILLPGLGAARRQARLTACVSNVRQQGHIALMYSLDFGDALPARRLTWVRINEDGEFENQAWLINRLLARYENVEFLIDDFILPHPMAQWRCPDVRIAADAERFTHSGVLHHAPNQWVFSTAYVNEIEGVATPTADTLPGWEASHGGSRWRRASDITFPEHVIALMDNVSFFSQAHSHRDAREHYGRACDIVSDPEPCAADNQGRHEELRQRPVAYVGGSAGALPSRGAFWLSDSQVYSKGPGPGEVLSAAEVRHLLWYVTSADGKGPGD